MLKNSATGTRNMDGTPRGNYQFHYQEYNTNVYPNQNIPSYYQYHPMVQSSSSAASASANVEYEYEYETNQDSFNGNSRTGTSTSTSTSRGHSGMLTSTTDQDGITFVDLNQILGDEDSSNTNTIQGKEEDMTNWTSDEHQTTYNTPDLDLFERVNSGQQFQMQEEEFEQFEVLQSEDSWSPPPPPTTSSTHNVHPTAATGSVSISQPSSMFERVEGAPHLRRCKLCGKVVKGLKHAKVHSPGTHICPYCPCVYTRRDNLTAHIRVKHT